MSPRSSGAREDHRLALRRRSIHGYRLRVLRHRHGFAGQHRLVDLEGTDLDEPGIGGDPVPRIHEEQVTGNDLSGVDLRLVSPSNHRRGASDTIAESEHGALRSNLLHEAEDPVQHDDDRDHRRLETLADHERDSGGGCKERHQRILELADGDSRVRRPFHLPDAIGAVLTKARVGLLGGETELHARLELSSHLGDWSRMRRPGARRPLSHDEVAAPCRLRRTIHTVSMVSGEGRSIRACPDARRG